MRKKTALITGGSRGIGRAIALDLAAQEWAVAIGYRQNQAAAQATLDAMQQKGGNGLALRADVSDPQAATFLVRQVEKTWGHLDALINTVGPYHRQNFFESSVESWHAMFDHNLHPVFYLCRAAAAGMQERKWGRIINFAVANADQLHSQPNVTAYYIAKVGVLILTRTLARLLGPYGITVNAVSPGVIDSDSVPQEELTHIIKKIPAGNIGTTDDVVAVLNFLLSEQARYVNGANIQVSGGWGI